MRDPQRVPPKDLGLLAGPTRVFPPPLPPRAGLIALPARQIVVVAEVLAGELAQLVFGRRPDAGFLVRQPLEQPLDAVVVLVLFPPRFPAPRPGAEVLLGDRHQLL